MCRYPTRKTNYTCGHSDTAIGSDMAETCSNFSSENLQCENITFVGLPDSESRNHCMDCVIRGQAGGLGNFPSTLNYASGAGGGGGDGNTGGSSSTEQGEQGNTGNSLGRERQLLVVHNHTMRRAQELSRLQPLLNDPNQPTTNINSSPYAAVAAAPRPWLHYHPDTGRNKTTPYTHVQQRAREQSIQQPLLNDINQSTTNNNPSPYAAVAAAPTQNFGPATTTNMTPLQPCGQPDCPHCWLGVSAWCERNRRR